MLPTPNMYLRDWADTPKSIESQFDPAEGICAGVGIGFILWLILVAVVAIRIAW